MKIGIIGCGAVGSLFAAHLAALDDVEVWIFDVWREHVEAIERDGLRLTGIGELHTRPRATADANRLPALDFGIVATKGLYTRDAIAASAHAFADAAVCSVQNGVGNEEVIAEYVPRVIRGTTFPAGRVTAPGLVQWDAAGKTWIGPFEPKPASMEDVTRLAETLTRSGMETEALADARGAQWTKLIFNAASNALCSLTHLPHGRAALHPDVRWVMDAVIAEGKTVADALGITMEKDPADLLEESIAVALDHKPSMLQDVSSRRRTEIDQLNGGICRFGDEVGIATPFNRTAWYLVRGLEASWQLEET
ncbi:MAG: 2-dehydropantoate 2-reductase [Actinobacteria bacterium]|nr:2-dehydropantoate 2-reductase [Actinomycetota bacterium]